GCPRCATSAGSDSASSAWSSARHSLAVACASSRSSRTAPQSSPLSRWRMPCASWAVPPMERRRRAWKDQRHMNHAETTRVRILLADDHGVVRAGLRALLETQADMVVVAEAEDGDAAVRLAAEHRPNVVIA